MDKIAVVTAHQAYEKATHLLAMLDETAPQEIWEMAKYNVTSTWKLYVAIMQEIEGF